MFGKAVRWGSFLGYLYLLGMLAGCDNSARLDRLFSAFDLMEATITAQAGMYEYKRRLVEATAGFNQVVEADPGFRDGAIGKELVEALYYFGHGSDWATRYPIRDKELLLKLSEVALHAPDSTDRSIYRSTPNADTVWVVEPWAYRLDVVEACQKRAVSHLENARIRAGRKRASLYTPPLPRSEADWLRFAAPEHPGRRKGGRAR